MENLTHTLVGVLLSRAGLDRWTPRAMALCVVAANLPDIDIVTAASPIDYLTYHRHITHSLPAAPVMALLAVLLVEGVHRLRRGGQDPIRWGPAFAVSLVATLSHIALDMTNAYGTRLWLPFNAEWSSWDVLFIVDPWVWLLLVLPLVMAPGLRFLRGGEGSRWARKVCLLGLAALAGYIGFRAALHENVILNLRERRYDGRAPVRVGAFPVPLDTFQWSAFVETDTAFLVGIADARRLTESPEWQRIEKARESEILRRARASPVARAYLDFATYARADAEVIAGGHRVQFSDFRFRRGNAAGFLCTVELDGDLDVTAEDFRLWGGGGLFSFARRIIESRPD